MQHIHIIIIFSLLFLAMYEKIKRIYALEDKEFYKERYEDAIKEYGKIHRRFYNTNIVENNGVYTIKQELKPIYQKAEEEESNENNL
jgi:hypothetical protein